MEMESSIPFNKAPLAALSNATRAILSRLLNPCKVLPSPAKYPRDFRGLAFVAEVPCPNACHDPTATVLKTWEEGKKRPTVADLISTLELIDRWDVIDDIKDFVEKDIVHFSKGAAALEKPNVSPNLESDKHILTIDDVLRIEKGLPLQFYDAFLLYSDEDVEFATQMIERLENQYNLKLCIKDRDLVGGVTFEHEAIMKLISDRCRRLIIILSSSFLESPANKFFFTYAQALGIEQRRRKIIPCTYNGFRPPQELSFYFVLHYTRSSPLWNFWDRLSASVKVPLPVITPRDAELSTVRITELPASQWDCLEKKPQRTLPALPATGDAGRASVGSKHIPTEPATTLSELNLNTLRDPPEAASESYGPMGDKSKSKNFSLTNLLPNPPTGRLNKIKWWKNKKKVKVDSSS